MKLRNFLIGLLVVLMAFVFISCEDEPEEVQPQPAAKDTIAKITVDKGIKESVWGNEKIQLQWDLGADSEGIKDGDVLLLQFRTNRAPYEFDLRTNKKGTIKEDGTDAKQDVRWVYQESEESLDSLTLGSDGWYTLKYTFGEDAKQGTPDYDTYRYTNLGVQFKCYLMEGDVFEVKNVTLNGKALPLSEDINIGKHCSIEIGTDHEWTMPKTYVVVYAENGEWDGDDGTEAEVVLAGAAPKGLLAENGYTITYTDEDDELVVLSELSIEEDTVINYTKVGDPRAVTFKVGEETFLSSSVENGKYASKPATDPTKEGGYQFAAWCADSGLETEFNFAETPITADTTLYAKFNKTWTVSFSLNGKTGTAPDDQIIVEGEKATAPTTNPKTSGFRFQNWKLDSVVFDFNTPITEDIELVAEWEVAPTVNFTYVKNDGSDDETVVPTFIGEEATSTKPADPTRIGHRFLGWFVGDTDTEYTFTEIVEAEDAGTVLKAHWVETVLQLTATKGRNEGMNSYDKYQLDFGSQAFNSGDTLTVVFRSTRPIDQFSIRHSANKWVYEQPKEGYPLPDGFLSGPDANGWITATYQFGTYYYNGTSTVTYPATGVLFHLRGMMIVGDILEIKQVAINGTPIADITSLVSTSKYVKPSTATVDIHSWDGMENTYVVYFYEDPSADSATAIAVTKNALVPEPATPVNPGFTFVGWCKDKTYDGIDPSRMWDFENDALNSNRMLYAIWAAE